LSFEKWGAIAGIFEAVEFVKMKPCEVAAKNRNFTQF
jgi:hypothetical protein